MPSKHAMLGPSSAHRWLVCTPSAKLESTFPSTTSKYAEEGTLAHSLCEAKLRKFLGNDVIIPEPADEEMEEYTTQYADFVEEELNAAKAECEGATLFVEQELNLEDYVPDGFGTSDAVIVSDTTLTVIDFKYGKGVPVDAYQNPQLRLYALGSYCALESLYDFDKVRMVIYQPRIGNISDDEMTVADLLDWGENFVKPQARKAYAGEGEYCTGEHCKFCKAGAVCKARMESVFPILDHDKVLSPVLTDAEIAPLMAKFDETRAWMDAIEAYAQDKAVSEGKKWEGYKLVEARTLRKISDPIAAADRLKGAGYVLDQYTNTKLKGIGDLEKLVGKNDLNVLLSGLIVKPVGAPTLVKNSDKRKEINPFEMLEKEN